MPTLGAKKAGEVTADDVRSALNNIRDTHGKQRRNPYNHTLVAVQSTYAWALGKGLTTARPTEHLKPLPASAPRKRKLDAEEIAVLWSAIGTTPKLPPKMRLVLRVLFLTGQRNSNITGARVEWIRPSLDVANPLLIVPAANMKAKTDEHVLPLVPSVARMFSEALADGPKGEFVFSNPRSKEGHYHNGSRYPKRCNV